MSGLPILETNDFETCWISHKDVSPVLAEKCFTNTVKRGIFGGMHGSRARLIKGIICSRITAKLINLSHNLHVFTR